MATQNRHHTHGNTGFSVVPPASLRMDQDDWIGDCGWMHRLRREHEASDGLTACA